jgi:ankyrin repeat protein
VKVESSPVFLAIRMGNVKAIELMCDNNIDFDIIRNSEGLTPIHLACDLGKDDIVSHLCLRTKNLDDDDPSKVSLLTKYLVNKNNKDMALKLIQRGANINY